MLSRMSSTELERWQAYYSIHPFGTWRDNYHTGIIASLINNSNSKKALQPNDFILRTKEEVREDNLEKSMSTLLAMSKPNAD